MPHTVCGDAYSERGRGCDLLDGWSGGMGNVLDRRVGRRHLDVAGLSVIEVLEEVGGELGVFPDKGVEVMVGQGG